MPINEVSSLCEVDINVSYYDNWNQGSLDSLFKEFPEVFKSELSNVPRSNPKHGIYHHIKTTGPPAHQKFRRLTPEKMEIAKRYFADMVRT